MKCKALRDGLIGKDQYVRAGEEFDADKCPSWAIRVNPPAKKADGGKTAPDKEGDA